MLTKLFKVSSISQILSFKVTCSYGKQLHKLIPYNGFFSILPILLAKETNSLTISNLFK